MRSVTWNQFPIKNLRLIPCLSYMWRVVIWIQIRESLNRRQKMENRAKSADSLKACSNSTTRVFLRRFRDPTWVSRISNREPRIRENYHRVPKIRENRVPKIRENRVPKIREIGSLKSEKSGPYRSKRVPNIFLKKNLPQLQSLLLFLKKWRRKTVSVKLLSTHCRNICSWRSFWPGVACSNAGNK